MANIEAADYFDGELISSDKNDDPSGLDAPLLICGDNECGGDDCSSSSSSPSPPPPLSALPPWRTLATAFVISFASAVDDSVVLPSLWPYLRYLGGTARTYGLCMLCYYFARLLAMPAIGRLVDRRVWSHASVFRTCLLAGAAASVLYAVAPAFDGSSGGGGGWDPKDDDDDGDDGSDLTTGDAYYATPPANVARGSSGPSSWVALWVIILARVVLGMSSAVSVAALSFLTEHTPPSRRTEVYSWNFGFQRACVPLGPVLNLAAVSLPACRIGSSFVLMKYNYAGLITAALNLLAYAVVVLVFQEPPRPAATAVEEDAQEDCPPPPPLTSSHICANLRRTGAYMSYFLSFQNNWNNQVVLWTLPVVTRQLYRLGVVGNSLIFAGGGVTGLITAFAFGRCCRGRSDRGIILGTQLATGAVLLAFTLEFGCGESMRGAAPPLWHLAALFCVYYIPFMGQMPANNSIYTKLIGPHHRGVYISILECSKTLARAVAGYAIGISYGSLGPCYLWSLTMGVWALQMVPFLANWQKLKLSDYDYDGDDGDGGDALDAPLLLGSGRVPGHVLIDAGDDGDLESIG